VINVRFYKDTILRKIVNLTLITDWWRKCLIREEFARIHERYHIVVCRWDKWGMYLQMRSDAQVRWKTRRLRGFRKKVNLVWFEVESPAYRHKGVLGLETCWVIPCNQTFVKCTWLFSWSKTVINYVKSNSIWTRDSHFNWNIKINYQYTK